MVSCRFPPRSCTDAGIQRGIGGTHCLESSGQEKIHGEKPRMYCGYEYFVINIYIILSLSFSLYTIIYVHIYCYIIYVYIYCYMYIYIYTHTCICVQRGIFIIFDHYNLGTVSFFGVKLEHAVSPRWGLGRCMTQPLEPLPNFMVDIAMYRVWVQRLGMSKMATTHIPDHPRCL